MDEVELRERLRRYRFYHTIKLNETVSTPGQSRPNEELSMRALHSMDLRGKRVLDVGCRDGKFAFEAERRGAAEVVAIDNDLSNGAVELLIPTLRSKVRMEKLNLIDLTAQHFGIFDVVMCFGVLYHLRHPFWAIRALRRVLIDNGTLLLETALTDWQERWPLLYCPVGIESPYEGTSCTFFNEKGLRDTFGSLGFEVRRLECLKTKHRGLPGRLALMMRRWITRGGPYARVYRAVFCCKKIGADADLMGYWEETHQLHSIGLIPSCERVSQRAPQS
jgi:SAM-dependent methyltransferase